MPINYALVCTYLLCLFYTPSKVEVLIDLEQPKNITKMKSFLGLAGYYCIFIMQFSQITSPLTWLTQKQVPFV